MTGKPLWEELEVASTPDAECLDEGKQTMRVLPPWRVGLVIF